MGGPQGNSNSGPKCNGECPQSTEQPVKSVQRETDEQAGERLVLPAPMDGGWGWVVVAASFICAAVVEGTISFIGIILPQLLQHYRESRAKTTFAGSLMVGVFLLSGPLVSVVLNKYGCRWTTMAGGVIATAALVFSTYAPSLNAFIPLYGALGGIGIGLIYLPATVMVGFYFEKKRALATGIATSGSGLGFLVYSMTGGALLGSWDWRPTLVLVSTLTLQAVVMGALLRPLEDNYPSPPSTVTTSPSTSVEEAQEEEEMEDRLSRFPQQEVQRLRTLSHGAGDSELRRLALSRRLVASGQESALHSSSHPNVRYKEPAAPQCNGDLNTDKELPSIVINGNCVDHVTRHKSCDQLRTHSTEVGSEERTRGSCNLPAVSMSWHQIPSASLSPSAKRRPPYLSSPLLRRDIFYSGSVCDLPEYQAPDSQTPAPSAACWLRGLVDVSLLTSPVFLVLLAANFLLQFSMFIPIVFLVDYAGSVGVPQDTAATLISAVGISNTIGRASAGALGNLRSVNCLYFTAASQFILGVATMLAPLLCKAYVPLMVYAVVYGLFLGVFVPLTTVLIVQYVGLHKLTAAYGLLSMVKGVASLLGPPIAGGILDQTASYQTAFFLAAAMFVLSGLVFCAAPCAYRCKPRPHTYDSPPEV